VVRSARLERATHCLEGSCSIHLSYGRALENEFISGLGANRSRYVRAARRIQRPVASAPTSNAKPNGCHPTPVVGVCPALPSSSCGDFFMLFVGDGSCEGVAVALGVEVDWMLSEGVDVITTLGV
jgi:hypothetical protein